MAARTAGRSLRNSRTVSAGRPERGSALLAFRSESTRSAPLSKRAERRRAVDAQCNIYVGNLLESVTKTDLAREFRRFGNVIDVWVARQPSGFAFIRFDNGVSASRAVQAFNERLVLGSRLRVEFAKPDNPAGIARQRKFSSGHSEPAVTAVSAPPLRNVDRAASRGPQTGASQRLLSLLPQSARTSLLERKPMMLPQRRTTPPPLVLPPVPIPPPRRPISEVNRHSSRDDRHQDTNSRERLSPYTEWQRRVRASQSTTGSTALTLDAALYGRPLFERRRSPLPSAAVGTSGRTAPPSLLPSYEYGSEKRLKAYVAPPVPPPRPPSLYRLEGRSSEHSSLSAHHTSYRRTRSPSLRSHRDLVAARHEVSRGQSPPIHGRSHQRPRSPPLMRRADTESRRVDSGQRSRSPAQKRARLLREVHSPVQYESNQSTRHGSRSGHSPVRSGRSPVRSGRSPVRSARSPVRSGRSPVRSARSPVMSGRSLVRSGRSPVRSARSPVRSVRSPVRSGHSPVRSGRSPVRSGRSPVRSARSPVRSVRSPVRSGHSPVRLGRSSVHIGHSPGPTMSTARSGHTSTKSGRSSVLSPHRLACSPVPLSRSIRSPERSSHSPVRSGRNHSTAVLSSKLPHSHLMSRQSPSRQSAVVDRLRTLAEGSRKRQCRSSSSDSADAKNASSLEECSRSTKARKDSARSMHSSDQSSDASSRRESESPASSASESPIRRNSNFTRRSPVVAAVSPRSFDRAVHAALDVSVKQERVSPVIRPRSPPTPPRRPRSPPQMKSRHLGDMKSATFRETSSPHAKLPASPSRSEIGKMRGSTTNNTPTASPASGPSRTSLSASSSPLKMSSMSALLKATHGRPAKDVSALRPQSPALHRGIAVRPVGSPAMAGGQLGSKPNRSTAAKASDSPQRKRARGQTARDGRALATDVNRRRMDSLTGVQKLAPATSVKNGDPIGDSAAVSKVLPSLGTTGVQPAVQTSVVSGTSPDVVPERGPASLKGNESTNLHAPVLPYDLALVKKEKDKTPPPQPKVRHYVVRQSALMAKARVKLEGEGGKPLAAGQYTAPAQETKCHGPAETSHRQSGELTASQSTSPDAHSSRRIPSPSPCDDRGSCDCSPSRRRCDKVQAKQRIMLPNKREQSLSPQDRRLTPTPSPPRHRGGLQYPASARDKSASASPNRSLSPANRRVSPGAAHMPSSLVDAAAPFDERPTSSSAQSQRSPSPGRLAMSSSSQRSSESMSPRSLGPSPRVLCMSPGFLKSGAAIEESSPSDNQLLSPQPEIFFPSSRHPSPRQPELLSTPLTISPALASSSGSTLQEGYHEGRFSSPHGHDSLLPASGNSKLRSPPAAVRLKAVSDILVKLPHSPDCITQQSLVEARLDRMISEPPQNEITLHTTSVLHVVEVTSAAQNEVPGQCVPVCEVDSKVPAVMAAKSGSPVPFEAGPRSPSALHVRAQRPASPAMSPKSAELESHMSSLHAEIGLQSVSDTEITAKGPLLSKIRPQSPSDTKITPRGPLLSEMRPQSPSEPEITPRGPLLRELKPRSPSEIEITKKKKVPTATLR